MFLYVVRRVFTRVRVCMLYVYNVHVCMYLFEFKIYDCVEKNRTCFFRGHYMLSEAEFIGFTIYTNFIGVRFRFTLFRAIKTKNV